jgi:hypothetical protein
MTHRWITGALALMLVALCGVPDGEAFSTGRELMAACRDGETLEQTVDYLQCMNYVAGVIDGDVLSVTLVDEHTPSTGRTGWIRWWSRQKGRRGFPGGSTITASSSEVSWGAQGSGGTWRPANGKRSGTRASKRGSRWSSWTSTIRGAW